ncbi:hypothetical protein Caci_1992 [Catenulispora acidiphila DSM 44928]|uniref:Pentapeptide repeat protein n=1 Tax=Catenulispora acidiphila (strain DSM 44928 / JCM 14897 / NBRC 102108 / NRRL B-24433 / ID139908) TaxID=479433 RepID=C7QFT5_CATAD|nr:pentapeptide repeat-containing protein [Catenulispora acidiphila]ACU70912.1 hypothetical protein Caci_1992 [Catenulispora acidiphila DSM 44928]
MDARLTRRLPADADGESHRAALQELEALAGEHPEQRQPIADALCRYLREPAAQAPAGQQAVALLAALARQHPDAPRLGADGSCAFDCEYCLDLNLDGAILPDVDFGDCRLGAVSLTDTHLYGDSVFAGTRFADQALFQRSVFEGDASFAGARFHRAADFGRARFRANADFSRVRFQNIAWFGRGEEALDEEDEAWEEIETRRTVAWEELNEDDPNWPIAGLTEEYQMWEEGGDGTRFNHGVSFTDATFAMEAWFWKARFGSAVSFQRCVFGGRVHLIQPAVDLTGARLTADAQEKGQEWPEGQDWPLGWTTVADLDDGGDALVVLDTSLSPYHLHLADPDPEVRLAGLRILGELGDAEPDLRERIADTVCAYLRTPLSFDVTTNVFDLAPSQFAELRTRRAAQRLLTDRTRQRPGQPLWEDIDLQLSGATLIDFDAAGCRLARADFSGAQFYGTTSFANATFGTKQSAAGSEISFALTSGGQQGRASFHGAADFSGLDVRSSGLMRCRFHADSAVRGSGTDQDLIRVLLGARLAGDAAEATADFLEALRAFSASAPYTLSREACENLIQTVEYGTVPGPPDAPWESRTGLKLVGTDVLLADLAGPISPAAPDADRLLLLGPGQREAAADVIRVLLTALEAD